jgi:hypothetical protein
MGCMIFVLALIGPRVALLFTWLATNLVQRAYDSFLVPFLGFLFLPWTTLIYALVWSINGPSVFGWFFVALGFAVDIASYGASQRGYAGRSPGAVS